MSGAAGSSTSTVNTWGQVAAVLLDLPIHAIKCLNCGIVLHSVERKIKYWCECKGVGIYGGMKNRKYMGNRHLIASPSDMELAVALAEDVGEMSLTDHGQHLVGDELFISMKQVPIEPIRCLYIDLCNTQGWSKQEALRWYEWIMPFVLKSVSCGSIAYTDQVHPYRAEIYADKVKLLAKVEVRLDPLRKFFDDLFRLVWKLYREGQPSRREAPVHFTASASAASSSLLSTRVDDCVSRMRHELLYLTNAVKKGTVDIVESFCNDNVFRVKIRYQIDQVMDKKYAKIAHPDTSFMLLLETNRHMHPSHPPIIDIQDLSSNLLRNIRCRHLGCICRTLLTEYWEDSMTIVDFGLYVAKLIGTWMDEKANGLVRSEICSSTVGLVSVFETLS